MPGYIKFKQICMKLMKDNNSVYYKKYFKKNFMSQHTRYYTNYGKLQIAKKKLCTELIIRYNPNLLNNGEGLNFVNVIPE